MLFVGRQALASWVEEEYDPAPDAKSSTRFGMTPRHRMLENETLPETMKAGRPVKS